MPISGRGHSYNNVQHTGIIDNPVFNIKVRGLATPNEMDKNVPKRLASNDITDTFKIGQRVTGSSLEKTGTYTGKIISINKNQTGEGSSITVIDNKTQKKIKLDPASCSSKKTNDYDPLTNQPGEDYNVGFYAENYIMSFDEFIELND